MNKTKADYVGLKRKHILSLRFFLFVSIILFISVGYSVDGLVAHIQKNAIVLETDSDLDDLIVKASEKKLVLLGEASHGTHEYYAWRDSISRRLISEHDFNFILVEGDFASLFELNKYVKDMPGAANSATAVLRNLDRWPNWMWGNHEVVQLAEWLREFNASLPFDEKVGFYGMDVYDEWRSKRALLSFLQTHNSSLHKRVQNKLDCFSDFVDDSWLYARYVQSGLIDCSEHTQEVVNLIYNHKSELEKIEHYSFFYVLQNAYVFQNAEKFYRKSGLRQRTESWNARALHMHKTSRRLLDFYGETAKGIIWAHNTHIGDASFTDMSKTGQYNIGELSREIYGKDNVLLVGFTTYEGKVQAGSNWGEKREEMVVPPAQNNSLEDIFYRTGIDSFYILFGDNERTHETFMNPMGNRAIGVVYNPLFDFRQFVSTVVPMRYDAMIFFRETQSLNPLID